MSAVNLQSLWSVTAPPGPVCSPLAGAQRCLCQPAEVGERLNRATAPVEETTAVEG